jgi:hypothetical protein
MPDTEKFVNRQEARSGRRNHRQILSVPYPKDDDPPQDNANFYACRHAKVRGASRFEKNGGGHVRAGLLQVRLPPGKREAAFQGARGQPVQERLALLGTLQYMGKPRLNADGTSSRSRSEGKAHSDAMPLLAFQGRLPEGACRCPTACAARGISGSTTKRALGSGSGKAGRFFYAEQRGRKPCAFVFEIIR